MIFIFPEPGENTESPLLGDMLLVVWLLYFGVSTPCPLGHLPSTNGSVHVTHLTSPNGEVLLLLNSSLITARSVPFKRDALFSIYHLVLRRCLRSDVSKTIRMMK